MKWWPAQCTPGDMVRVRIGSVWHYGVYVSDGEVIQFGTPPRGDAAALSPQDVVVCSTTMDEFAGGTITERAMLSCVERLKRIPPKKTVAIARRRLGDGGYNLLHNNCEHFAYECVFGYKFSEQEEQAKRQWRQNAAKTARKQGGDGG